LAPERAGNGFRRARTVAIPSREGFSGEDLADDVPGNVGKAVIAAGDEQSRDEAEGIAERREVWSHGQPPR